MSGFYTEADYENSIIELFQNMGYRYVYGPDVDRDFNSPLYEEELNAALRRLNPTMPEDAIASTDEYKTIQRLAAEVNQAAQIVTDNLPGIGNKWDSRQ